MLTRRIPRPGGPLFVASVVGLLALALPAGAADKDNLPQSLKLVPADAEFYSASLRLGEQWKAVKESKAWQKLKTIEGLNQILPVLENPVGAVRGTAGPAEVEAVELLGDMLSREVFWYSGGGVGDFLALMQEVSNANQWQQVFSGGQANPNQQARAVLLTLQENRERIKIPNFVLGFRVEDPKRAARQLARLEGLLKGLAQQNPNLKDRVKREKTAGGDFITITLDGNMVPWEQVPIKDYEEKQGEFKPLIEKLKGLKLTVALGTRDDYVLLAIGESAAAALKGFGAEGKGLAGRPELKPVLKHADKRLAGVTYLSKEFAAAYSTKPKDIDEMVKSFKEELKEAQVEAGLKKRLAKDLDEFAKDIKPLIPEPSASTSFSWLTGHGYEGYGYDWAKPNDKAAPLTLLNNLGGAPLLAVITRWDGLEKDYQILAKWFGKGLTYVEEFGLPHIENMQERQKAKQFLQAIKPHLKRFDEITRQTYLPAITGEWGFVLDARLKGKTWVQAMPPAGEELPLIEPAFVEEVKDAAKYKKALGEYREVINKMLAEVRKLDPNEIPPLEIPKAKTKEVKGGTLYYYPVPKEAGLDERIILGVAVGEKVAAYGVTAQLLERLVTPTPAKLPGPLAKADRPLYSAAYANFEGIVKAATPWVLYAVKMGLDQQGTGEQERDSILKQVRTGLEVLTVFRTYASATYAEEGAEVTHYEIVIRDLGAK